VVEARTKEPALAFLGKLKCRSSKGHLARKLDLHLAVLRGEGPELLLRRLEADTGGDEDVRPIASE